MVNRLSPTLFEQNCIRQPLTDAQRARGLTIGCLLWRPGRNPGHPYGLVKIAGDNWTAHRASYTVHIGPIPDGKMACHHCDAPRCCEPTHLYAGTAKLNWQDMISRGRHPSHGGFPAGAQSLPRVAKLSPADVERILISGESAAELAVALGVGRSAIYLIRNGDRKRTTAPNLPRHDARPVGLIARRTATQDWYSDERGRIEARAAHARAKRLAHAEARRAAGDMRRHDLLPTIVLLPAQVPPAVLPVEQ